MTVVGHGEFNTVHSSGLDSLIASRKGLQRWIATFQPLDVGVNTELSKSRVATWATLSIDLANYSIILVFLLQYTCTKVGYSSCLIYSIYVFCTILPDFSYLATFLCVFSDVFQIQLIFYVFSKICHTFLCVFSNVFRI